MSKAFPFCLFFILLNGLLSFPPDTLAQKGLNIAFLTDIHITPGSISEKALTDIVDEVNRKGLDALILTGDLTNNGSDAELNAVKNCLDRLTIPYCVIPGNHETNWSESAGKTFPELFGSDRFVFSAGHYLFVGFSTGPYLKMGDGHVKKEDLLWLKNTLQQEMTAGKRLIAASHYPLKDGLDNWFEVTEIIKPFSPILTLCGHEHRLSWHNFDGIAGLMGRPLFYKNDAASGYTILSLKEDSVFVYEKKTGESPPLLFASFSTDNREIIRGLPSDSRPDYSINDGFRTAFESKVVIQDSSSVFSGIGWKNDVLIYGNSSGKLTAYNYKKERTVWQKQYQSAIHSSPLVAGNIVYLGDSGGLLHAINIDTGKEKWSVSLGAPIIGDILLNDGFLYVGAGKELCKVNAENGRTGWTFRTEGQLQACPATNGKEVVFGAWDRHLYCVDVKTGALKWKWNNNKPGILLSPANVTPAISSGKVFIVAPDRHITAIDIATGATIWRTGSHAVRESMGISKDGLTIYAKLMNDSIIAVSAEEDRHKDLWVMNAGFGYDHNPCRLVEQNNILYMATKNGLLIAIDTTTRKILFQYKCGNSSVNKIMPDNTKGGIWLTTTDGFVIWVEPKTKIREAQ